MIFKLAWRNLWRNKRRTAITATAIFFAVLASVFMNAIQKGTWDKVIDSMVQFHTGAMQLQVKAYWEEPSLDNSFAWTEKLEQSIPNSKLVKTVMPRLEGFALAFNYTDTASQGIMLIGMIPEREKEMSKLNERLTAGEYLQATDKSILVAEGLAKKLKLEIGDTLTLVSQGYHGANAAALYPVKGIVKFGSPELNKRMVYLPLKETQSFFAAENQITALVFNMPNRLQADQLRAELTPHIDSENLRLMDWSEMLPELVQTKAMKEGGSVMMLGILYLVIAFGIFGTILMMTEERKYEFGVLISIGMRRFTLALQIWIETVFIGFLGVFMGLLAGIPLVYYFHVNPIVMGPEFAETYEKFGIEPVLPTAFSPEIFYDQIIIVLILTTFLAIYPLFKIMRLFPVEAMRR